MSLIGQSPDYLEIEWEGICRITHLPFLYYYDSPNIILGCLWAAGVSAVPAVFLVIIVEFWAPAMFMYYSLCRVVLSV